MKNSFKALTGPSRSCLSMVGRNGWWLQESWGAGGKGTVVVRCLKINELTNKKHGNALPSVQTSSTNGSNKTMLLKLHFKINGAALRVIS